MKEAPFDPDDIRGNLKELQDLHKKQQRPEIKVNVIAGGIPKAVHRWNLFIGHYLSNGMNGQQAARDAGYGVPGAKRQATYLLAMPVIKKEIARVVNKKLEYLEVTFEWKMDMLKNTIEKCANGEQLKDNHMNASGVISGVAELNKMQGHYSPEKRVNLNVTTDSEDELFNRLLLQNQKEY